MSAAEKESKKRSTSLSSVIMYLAFMLCNECSYLHRLFLTLENMYNTYIKTLIMLHKLC